MRGQNPTNPVSFTILFYYNYESSATPFFRYSRPLENYFEESTQGRFRATLTEGQFHRPIIRRHLLGDITQGGAQTLLNGGMIERHLQHFSHCHPVLEGEGEKMGQVFRVGNRHFGAKETHAVTIHVYVEETEVASFNAGS